MENNLLAACIVKTKPNWNSKGHAHTILHTEHALSIIAQGQIIGPIHSNLGQICPQCSSDCRATILTVGWLPYRKVSAFLMRIL